MVPRGGLATARFGNFLTLNKIAYLLITTDLQTLQLCNQINKFRNDADRRSHVRFGEERSLKNKISSTTPLSRVARRAGFEPLFDKYERFGFAYVFAGIMVAS